MIEDRFACQDLMLASYQAVDEGNASIVAEMFTEDGLFVIEGNLKLQGRNHLLPFFKTREENRERVTLHVLSNLIYSRSSDTESAINALLQMYLISGDQPLALQAFARVADSYRSEAGQYRIASRITTVIAS